MYRLNLVHPPIRKGAVLHKGTCPSFLGVFTLAACFLASAELWYGTECTSSINFIQDIDCIDPNIFIQSEFKILENSVLPSIDLSLILLLCTIAVATSKKWSLSQSTKYRYVQKS